LIIFTVIYTFINSKNHDSHFVHDEQGMFLPSPPPFPLLAILKEIFVKIKKKKSHTGWMLNSLPEQQFCKRPREAVGLENTHASVLSVQQRAHEAHSLDLF
jgi:hypothetical protein